MEKLNKYDNSTNPKYTLTEEEKLRIKCFQQGRLYESIKLLKLYRGKDGKA